VLDVDLQRMMEGLDASASASCSHS